MTDTPRFTQFSSYTISDLRSLRLQTEVTARLKCQPITFLPLPPGDNPIAVNKLLLSVLLLFVRMKAQ
jgi:hypothetical protein